MFAQSSGEAELYSIGAGAPEPLGLALLLREMEAYKVVHIRIHTDSRAAKAMSTRVGASRATEHIELRHCFTQEIRLRSEEGDCRIDGLSGGRYVRRSLNGSRGDRPGGAPAQM